MNNDSILICKEGLTEMKFPNPDRMLQLGIVPALTNFIKIRFPEASASLWQRDAKREYRKILDASLDRSKEKPCGAYARVIFDVAALLIAFHVAAPKEITVTEEDFDSFIDVALKTPIVGMYFDAHSPFEEQHTHEFAEYLSHDKSRSSGSWEGELSALGDSSTQSDALLCAVSHCGLLDMCVANKRYYLLKYLCKLEGSFAACGCKASTTSRFAWGDAACEIKLERA